MSILDLNIHLLTFFTIEEITQEIPQNHRAEWIKASILKQSVPVSYKPSMHDIFVKSTVEEINKMINFIHPQEMKDFYLEIAANIGFVHNMHMENKEIKEQYYPLFYEAFKIINNMPMGTRSKCLKNAKRIINYMVSVAPDLFTRRDIAFTHNVDHIAFCLGFDSMSYYTDDDVMSALDDYMTDSDKYLERVYENNKKEISKRIGIDFEELEYKTDVTGANYYEYNIEDLVIISHPSIKPRIFTHKELEFLQKDGRDLRNRQQLNKTWLNIWKSKNVFTIEDMIEDLFKYQEQENKTTNNNNMSDLFGDLFLYAFSNNRNNVDNETGNNVNNINRPIRWSFFSNDIFRF